MSDPVKENAKEQLRQMNETLSDLRNKLSDPEARKKFKESDWDVIKGGLVQLKSNAIHEIPGPYGYPLSEWYAELWFLDFYFDQISFELGKKNDPNLNPKYPDFDWGTISNLIDQAEEKKREIEKMVE